MTEPVFLRRLHGAALLHDSVPRYAIVRRGDRRGACEPGRLVGAVRRLVPDPICRRFIFCSRRARRQLRLLSALLFGAIASLGPLYWLAHNWWLYNNPFEFYNGPYSAKAIYQRSGTYPGDHDWRKAWLFFRTAAVMCAGWGAVIVAGVGLVGCIIRRTLWPMLLLALPSGFYLWSMYSGGTPIFVPQLWFGSYYNTRYGLAPLPLFAAAGAGVVLLIRGKWRIVAAVAAILAGVIPWLVRPQRGQLDLLEGIAGELRGSARLDSRRRSLSGRSIPARRGNLSPASAT